MVTPAVYSAVVRDLQSWPGKWKEEIEHKSESNWNEVEGSDRAEIDERITASVGPLEECGGTEG